MGSRHAQFLAVAVVSLTALVAAGTPIATAQPLAEPSVAEQFCSPTPVDVTTTTTVTPTTTTVAPTPECDPGAAPPLTTPPLTTPPLTTPRLTTEAITPTAVTTTPEPAAPAVTPTTTTTPDAAVSPTESTDTPPTTTTTAVSTTAPPTTTDDLDPASRALVPEAAAAQNLLNIQVPSSISGPSTVMPGATWTGTMSLTVLGVGLSGFTSQVSLSTFLGANTGRTLTPTSATYSAPSSACTAGLAGSSAAVSVPLNAQPRPAKAGGALCLTSWTSTVSVAVPSEGVISDTYSATLTHSIY